MFICKECGTEAPIWSRYCPKCSSEMSLKKKPLLLESCREEKPDVKTERLPSGFNFFDFIFGGGFLVSFLYYIFAEKGAGKTTFLLQICSFLVAFGKKVVFFSFDEGRDGIEKKFTQYGLSCHRPVFIWENLPGVIERTLQETKPDFVVIDSLQTFAKYKKDEIVDVLYRIRLEAQKRQFALVVVGEERKDKKSYLGSASIGHICDVIIKMEVGLDGEVILSTPEKNRDTDNKTTRCFFKRTPRGLIEISESQTGFLPRHSEKKVIGMASFISRDGNEFFADEMIAAIDKLIGKPTLTIPGINNARSKYLLNIVNEFILLNNTGFIVKSNRSQKNLEDAELACIVAVLSLLYEKPIPVDTTFIGRVDNRGHLIPVEGMEHRTKRAEALGYKHIIGPKASGLQYAIWLEAETVKEVLLTLGFIE